MSQVVNLSSRQMDLTISCRYNPETLATPFVWRNRKRAESRRAQPEVDMIHTPATTSPEVSQRCMSHLFGYRIEPDFSSLPRFLNSAFLSPAGALLRGLA